MSWNDYWAIEADGIEELEELHDSSWERALVLILFFERRFRRRVSRQAGMVDLEDRGQVRSFLGFVRREVDAFVASLSAALVGLRGGRGAIDPTKRRNVIRGVQGKAIRRAAAIAEKIRARAVKILTRDLGQAMKDKILPIPQGLAVDEATTVIEEAAEKAIRASTVRIDPKSLKTTQGIEAALARATPGSRLHYQLSVLQELDRQRVTELDRWRALQKETSRQKREGEDMADILNEAKNNPLRNIRNETDRTIENIQGLSSRHSRPGSARDVQDYMEGDPDAPPTAKAKADGWRLNRGRMRLSVAAHIRATQRRRVVTEAVAQGIRHFRLDVPRRRLGKIDPQGGLGQHLWRVRTLEEWQHVHRKANQGRVASSAFDGLGLGFGDVSYIVPVPGIYLAEARAQGLKLRSRWLGKRLTMRRRAA